MQVPVLDRPVTRFSLPPELEASAPPEYRGLSRDQVRLMVLDRITGAVTHTHFNHLSDFLRKGDLLVMNASRTIPALLHAKDDQGQAVEVRLAHQRGPDLWEAIILDGLRQVGRIGMHLTFNSANNTAPIMAADVIGRRTDLPFLYQVQFSVSGVHLLDAIYRLGEPVRYYYVKDVLPIDLYQTVYATTPGSAEMPSAGRAFSWQLLARLRKQGIGFASLVLHTGLSSTRDDALDALHPNYEEEYFISSETAQAVNQTRQSGGRVIAIGTTVVRALETVADGTGVVHADHGWTRLWINSGYLLRVVDGILTGFHEPVASHLDLLQAFVDPHFLFRAYQEAIALRYLWHEFGDMNLIV